MKFSSQHKQLILALIKTSLDELPKAHRPDTGAVWTAACYFTKNVMKLPRELLHAFIPMTLTVVFGDGIHEKLENKGLQVDRNGIYTTLCRI